MIDNIVYKNLFMYYTYLTGAMHTYMERKMPSMYHTKCTIKKENGD